MDGGQHATHADVRRLPSKTAAVGSEDSAKNIDLDRHAHRILRVEGEGESSPSPIGPLNKETASRVGKVEESKVTRGIARAAEYS